MAPEQLLGETLDRRADVFALGILLFELATHQRLFKRASDFLTAKAILEEPIPRADAVDPAVPGAVAEVIAKALARAPGERYATAADLGAALETAFAPHGGVAPPPVIATALADWHGAELSAMRTRQARVLGDAQSQLATRPRSATMPPITAGRRWPVLAGALAIAAVATTAIVLRRPSASAPATRADAALPIDAAPAETAVVDAGVDAAAPDAAPVEPAVTPLPRKPGLFSVDSTPFATIFVDGKRLGVTPLVKQSLPAVTHRVRAVLADGRERTIEIDVPAGKVAKPLVLTW
jgi:serine/threonine-protein kinase